MSLDLNPEERDKTAGGECGQEAKGLNACSFIGQAVGVNSFDQVVAGGGDQDGACGYL